jgi:DNA polymerase III subunit epsilon
LITGGWAAGDRITEIGAVKVRNHLVIDEWHSLVNPQRSIPAKITQITGITNEMVRDAPVFTEIADSFMQFMGDGIFVAHNVNFDYGFVGYEYQRLERRFRFPKLCTVAGMRRRYPGHKSYVLGKLCEIFNIALETHHRALCDARATSHLLNLIMQRGNNPRLAKRIKLRSKPPHMSTFVEAITLTAPSDLPLIRARQSGALRPEVAAAASGPRPEGRSSMSLPRRAL